MSHQKAWKEFSYIKNDQWKDSQSELSESQSSRSYHFNKMKFSKQRQNIQTSVKKFQPPSIRRSKEKSIQNSAINESLIKRGQGSFIQRMNQSQIQLNLSSSKNRKVQLKMKKFVLDVRRIHDELKSVAESIVCSFQKIKEELETNLLQVIDHLIKNSNHLKNMQVIHQLVHKSFQQMKKNVSILPYSLTYLNNSREEISILKNRIDSQTPQSPLLQPLDSLYTTKPKTKIHSIFSPKQPHERRQSDFNFELPISSSQKPKMKAQTQRKTPTRYSSFQGQIPVRQFEEVQRVVKDSKSKARNEFLTYDKSNNLQNIIVQMRSILNQ